MKMKYIVSSDLKSVQVCLRTKDGSAHNGLLPIAIVRCKHGAWKDASYANAWSDTLGVGIDPEIAQILADIPTDLVQAEIRCALALGIAEADEQQARIQETRNVIQDAVEQTIYALLEDIMEFK
jgi:hypothetical protein